MTLDSTWALVVIDMQNDFLHRDGYYAQREGEVAPTNAAGMRSSTLPGVVENVCRLVRLARTRNFPVAFVQAVYDRRFDVTPPGLRRDPQRVDYPCRPNTWGVEFVAPIAQLIEAPDAAPQCVVEKHTYDAFHETELHHFLERANVTDVAFCGTETQVCVLASAAHATFLGYLSYIIEDAVWSMNSVSAAAALDIFRDAYGETLRSDTLGA